MNRRSLHEQVLISKNFSILHALLHSEDSTNDHLHKNSNHVILYTHLDIHRGSIFALNYMYFYSMYIYPHTIHPELKILFHLPSTLN